MALVDNGNTGAMVKPSAVLTLVSLNACQIRQRGGRPNNVNMANVRIASLGPSVNISMCMRVRVAGNVVNDNAFSGGSVRPLPVVSGTAGQNDKGGNDSKAHGLTLARPMQKRR